MVPSAVWDDQWYEFLYSDFYSVRICLGRGYKINAYFSVRIDLGRGFKINCVKFSYAPHSRIFSSKLVLEVDSKLIVRNLLIRLS